MISCPNKSHPDWLKLVDKYGEDTAYKMWVNNDFEIPKIDTTPKNNTLSPSLSIEDRLLKSGFFARYNQGIFVKSQFQPQAENLIGQINKENPGLIELKRANVFGKGGRSIYYININKQGRLLQLNNGKTIEQNDQELDNYLLEFLKREFGVQSKEWNDLKAKLGIDALGATDILNKLIWYNKDRNIETIPEEAGHMIFALMGEARTGRFLLDHIHEWSEFENIRRKYLPIYKNEKQVRIEAIGQLIGKALVKNYKVTGLDKSLIQKALDLLDEFFKKLRNSIFGQTPYKVADRIALEVLRGNKNFLTAFESPRNPLVNYNVALEDNPFAKNIIDKFTNEFGAYLTGSLAIAGQGEDVYRNPKDPIHDLDFKLPYTDNQDENLEKISDWLESQGAIQIHSGWNKKTYTTYSYLIPKEGNLGAIERDQTGWIKPGGYKLFDNNFNQIPITKENVIGVDIFVQHSKQEINTINGLLSWQDIYEGKLSLSRLGEDERLFQREKDQEDYVLSRPKDLSINKPQFTYYQLNPEDYNYDLDALFELENSGYIGSYIDDIPEELLNEQESLINDFDIDLDAFNESLISEKYKKAFNTQLNILQNLEKELSGLLGGESDNPKRKELNRRKNTVSASIEILKRKAGYDTMIFVQQRAVDRASQILDTADTTDLNYVNSVIKHTDFLLNILREANNELSIEQKAKLQNLWANNGLLSDKYKVKSIEIYRNEVEGIGVKYTPITTPKKDIGIFKREGLSAREVGISESQAAQKLLDHRKAVLEEKMHEFNKQKIRFLSDRSWKDKVKSFYDAHGRFIVKTKSEYYLEQKKMLEETGEIIFNKNSTWEERRSAILNRDRWYTTHNTYEYNPIKTQKYLEDRNNWIEDNKDIDGNPPSDSSLALWEMENSPESYKKYMERLKNYPQLVVDPYSKPKYGYRYLDQIPNAEYTYNDPNDQYNKIKDDPLYQFIAQSFIESIQRVPHRSTVDLNDFGQVLNNFTIDLQNQDKFVLSEFLKGLGDTFTSWFGTSKLNSQDGKLSPEVVKLLKDKGFETEGDVLKYYSDRGEFMKITGLNSTESDFVFDVLIKENPYATTWSVTDSEGNDLKFISRPDISKFTKEADSDHLLDILEDFYRMSLTYEYKSNTLPILNLLYQKLGERPSIKKNKLGKVEKDNLTGNVKEIQGGLNNAKDQLMYLIKAEIFDERKTDAGSTAAKYIDPVVNFTRRVGLWARLFAPVSNVLFGKIQNHRWAAKGTDFNDLDLGWADTVLVNSVIRYLTLGKLDQAMPMARKITYLMAKMGDPEFASIIRELDTAGKLDKLMFTLMTSGEFLVHAQGLLAMMRHTKIKDLSGNERSLWDYYLPGKNELEYNHKEFGELKEWESVQNPLSDLVKFRDRFKEYRKSTQGDYFSPLKGKEYVLGRSLFVYKTWLPQFIYNRLGATEEELGFKGSYITYKDIFKANIQRSGIIPGGAKSIATILGNLVYVDFINKGKTFENIYKNLGLTQVDIENMRMNIRELRMMAFFLTLALLLKKWNDDDDSEELNVLTNLSQRAFYDLSFFYSPNSALNIIRNPIPLAKTVQDFLDTAWLGTKYLVDPESDKYERRGDHLFDSRFMEQFMKTTPGISTIPNTIGVMNQTFNNQAYKHSQ